jgi:hypothetical protein
MITTEHEALEAALFKSVVELSKHAALGNPNKTPAEQRFATMFNALQNIRSDLILGRLR